MMQNDNWQLAGCLYRLRAMQQPAKKQQEKQQGAASVSHSRYAYHTLLIVANIRPCLAIATSYFLIYI